MVERTILITEFEDFQINSAQIEYGGFCEGKSVQFEFNVVDDQGRTIDTRWCSLMAEEVRMLVEVLEQYDEVF